MTEIYRYMGSDIRKHLEGLRPAQLEQLEAAFSEVDGGGGVKLKDNGPKETITTNIDPYGVKGGPVAKNTKKPPNGKA